MSPRIRYYAHRAAETPFYQLKLEFLTRSGSSISKGRRRIPESPLGDLACVHGEPFVAAILKSLRTRRREPLPQLFGDFKPASPGQLADAASATVLNKSEQEWKTLKASRRTVKMPKALPDAGLEAFRGVFRIRKGRARLPKNAETYYPPKAIARVAAEAGRN